MCKTCKEVIELQKELFFPLITQERGFEINNRIKEISNNTGKPIMTTMIAKDDKGKYNINSVKYTGE